MEERRRRKESLERKWGEMLKSADHLLGTNSFNRAGPPFLLLFSSQTVMIEKTEVIFKVFLTLTAISKTCASAQDEPVGGEWN